MSQATSPSSPPAAPVPRAENAQLQDRVRSLRLSRIPDGTSYFRTAIAWCFAVFVLGVCGWLAYQAIESRGGTGRESAEKKTGDSQPNKSKSPSDSSNAAPASTVSQVTPQGEIALEAKGYIIPAHQSLVSPKVSGMIVELLIEEGKRFNAGDLLAQIETKEYQYDLDRAVAAEQAAAARWREAKRRLADMQLEVDQTQAQIDEVAEQIKQIKQEWDRKNSLRKNGNVTEQELEEIESKIQVALKKKKQLELAHELMKTAARQERLDAAKGDWDTAKAEVDKAKWKVDNCRIVAPIKGTILRKNAEKGNNVNPIAQMGSTSLCEMADLSDLEVELNIPERDIAVIRVGQRCTVVADAWPKREYKGVVSRLMPIADRAKAAVPVRVKVTVPADEEGVYLKPEMNAKVVFLNGPLAAPAAAESIPAAVPEETSAFPAETSSLKTEN
ncbi:MAG: efflux RND transporter periplasmic adaptor subunit [Planctomycetales bacterium]|nr:efflux RND transporter periplasmic adaptor subunit [Planctomycetales bacterium]